MKKKGNNEKSEKAVPDQLYFLGQARKYAGLSTKALKRGDGTAALSYSMISNFFLGMLNRLLKTGRVPKANWYRVQVKKMIIRLDSLVDAVPDEEK